MRRTAELALLLAVSGSAVGGRSLLERGLLCPAGGAVRAGVQGAPRLFRR